MSNHIRSKEVGRKVGNEGQREGMVKEIQEVARSKGARMEKGKIKE